MLDCEMIETEREKSLLEILVEDQNTQWDDFIL